MLELKNIKKSYTVGDIKTKALDGIDIAFRDKEFVAILGVSGSGKTTCLNIIGGLDRYDSGEMIIKGKNTKNFKEVDWDAYRNHSIGFVFQSYNLISHISIVDNVELGMTLGGISKAERNKKAIEILKRVGLGDHLHKKPNQLSGGQMQRVAIARALSNEPEILLCDEPTGALDTQTSIQIMDLIKEISQERLVIMVTHNPEIANQYADRIVRFQDGKVISDSNPYNESEKKYEFSLKRTSMSFLTALKLSFNNIKTKKGRTFLTAFASSIGIIGIAVILSLSTGFQTKIDEFQSDAMNEFPIMISQGQMQVDAESMDDMRSQMMGKRTYVDSDEVFLYDPADLNIIHHNILDEDFIKYINNVDPAIASGIGYVRMTNLNLIRKTDDKINPVSIMGRNSRSGDTSSMSGMALSSYPIETDKDAQKYLEKNYELVYGEYPKNEFELILVVSTKNEINFNTLKNLGFNTDDIKSIKFDEIVGTEFKLVKNNDYYVKTEFGTYLPASDYSKMYDLESNRTLRISGIVRQGRDSDVALLAPGLAYSDKLLQTVIADNIESDIVNAQQDVKYNIMTMKEISDQEKESSVTYLGGSYKPVMIMIYPNGFVEKDMLTQYLDDYNKGKDNDDKIIYTDLASTISSMTGGIMSAITIVLISFAAISLVVSLIMISIITYVSVLERTKEIGILRALGARKKDITRVFDAETCILGVFSGSLGVLIAYLLTFPINILIYNMTDLKSVTNLQPMHAISLVVLSTVLTMLGGHIPAKMASRKDAVEALRTE
jgi:putative ABC transport system permease protein